jgi:hypothetical protein
MNATFTMLLLYVCRDVSKSTTGTQRHREKSKEFTTEITEGTEEIRRNIYCI